MTDIKALEQSLEATLNIVRFASYPSWTLQQTELDKVNEAVQIACQQLAVELEPWKGEEQ